MLAYFRSLRKKLEAIIAHSANNTAQATQSPTHYNYWFENINDALFIHDLAGRFLAVNSVVCQRLGYTREELLQMNVKELDTPEYALRYSEGLEVFLREGSRVVETYHRCKDGGSIPIEINARLIEYDGAPAVLSVARDISPRKRAENALRKSEATWRAFLNAITDSALLIDRTGTILALNETAARRLGKPADELLGACIHALLPPDIAAKRKSYGDTVFQLGKPIHFEDVRAGECFEHTVYPVFDDQGKVTQVAIRAQNTTEQKRTLQALQEAEKRYRDIFENSVEGIFQSTPAGQYLSVNPAMARIHGYASAEEMIASVGNDIAHKVCVDPDRRMEFKRILEEQGVVKNFEAQNYRKDGTVIWTSDNARAVRDSNGTLLYYEGFLEDITERKRAEEKNTRLTERLDLATRGAHIGIWDWDIRKDALIWDDRMYELYGVKREDFSGAYQAWLNGLHPDDRAASNDISERARRGEIEYDTEFRVVLPNGTVRVLKAYGDVIRDSEGNPVRMIGVNFDITERRRSEQALRDSEARYRLLMEQAVDGIAVIDASGKYVDVNSTGCEMLGYTREEFLTKTVADILAPGSLEQQSIPFNLMRDGKAVVLDRVMRRKDGSLFPVEVHTKMLPDGRFHGIFTDISERKHLEAQVQTMLAAQQKWNAELESKVRVKTAELEQLSAMRDQLLRRMITAQEEERRRVARELHDETSQALTALIANLAITQTLPPAKMKTHLADIKSSIVEILNGVNHIVLDLRPTLLDDYGLMPALSWCANRRLSPKIQVEIVAPEPEVRLPPAMETLLFRIGQEAISNIVKHAKASSVRLTLTEDKPQNMLTLKIADNGIGFDQEHLEQPSRADRPHLGLLGMQERVQLIGGTLQIRSEPGLGTVVSATIPFTPSGEQE